MAYVAIVLNCTETIAQLKDRLTKGDTTFSIQLLDNLIQKTKAGDYSGGTLQVTVRDTDPAVATHGSGSAQYTKTLA